MNQGLCLTVSHYVVVVVAQSTDESGSDYCPGQGRRRGRKERRKRANDGDWEDEGGYARTTGRRREHIRWVGYVTSLLACYLCVLFTSYKESSEAEEEGDEVIEIDGATQQPVEDNRECIDKVKYKISPLVHYLIDKHSADNDHLTKQ